MSAKLHLTTRRIVLFVLLAGTLIGIWQAQNGYRSGIFFKRSQSLQDGWTAAPENLTIGNWRSAGEDLYSALTLNSNEAEYLKRYGLLISDERRLLGDDITREALRQIYTNSFESHRLAIKQRPASPYVWTYFAFSKALAGHLDAEFDLALERSESLGPWEKTNHILVARIVRFYWQSMSQNGRHYSSSILQRALSTPGFDEPIIEYFNSSDQFKDELCPALILDKLTERARFECSLQ